MPTSRKFLGLLAVVVLTMAGAVVTNGQTSNPANSKTQGKSTTKPSSSPNTSKKPATGESCGNFGDGMGYTCYKAATSTTTVGNSPTLRTSGSYQLPNINWGALSSTRISPSDLAQTCQDNLSRIRGQVDASSLNAYQVSCDLGAKCLPQCSGLGSNDAVSSCLDRCFAFDDTNNSTVSFSPELRQRVVMDMLLNGTSAASHSAAVIDPSAFAQAGSDPVDQNMQDLLNDNPAPPPPSPLHTAVQNTEDAISDTASDVVHSMKQGTVNFYNWVSNGFSFEATPAAENDAAAAAWEQFNGSTDGGDSAVDDAFVVGKGTVQLSGNPASGKTASTLFPVIQGTVNNESHFIDDSNNALLNGGLPPQFNKTTDLLGPMPLYTQTQGIADFVNTKWQSLKGKVKDFFKDDPQDLFNTNPPQDSGGGDRNQ